MIGLIVHPLGPLEMGVDGMTDKGRHIHFRKRTAKGNTIKERVSAVKYARCDRPNGIDFFE
jgi:hypothetical protein